MTRLPLRHYFGWSYCLAFGPSSGEKGAYLDAEGLRQRLHFRASHLVGGLSKRLLVNCDATVSR